MKIKKQFIVFAFVFIYIPKHKNFIEVQAILHSASERAFDLGLKKEKIKIYISVIGENSFNVKSKICAFFFRNKIYPFSSMGVFFPTSKITNWVPSTIIKIDKNILPYRSLFSHLTYDKPEKVHLINRAEHFNEIIKEIKNRITPNIVFQNSVFELMSAGSQVIPRAERGEGDGRPGREIERAPNLSSSFVPSLFFFLKKNALHTH